MSQGGDIACQDTVSPSTRPKAVVLQRDDVVYNIFWRSIQKEAQQSRSLAHCETGSFSVFLWKLRNKQEKNNCSPFVYCFVTVYYRFLRKTVLCHLEPFSTFPSKLLFASCDSDTHMIIDVGELFIQIICAESLLNQGPSIGLEELLEAGQAPQNTDRSLSIDG